MSLAPIMVNEELEAFLLARVKADQEDATIAYRFLTAWRDETDDKARDWFAFSVSEGVQRISYTTRERVYERGRQRGADPNPFDHGTHRIVGRVGAVTQAVIGSTIDGRALDVFCTAAQNAIAKPPDIELVKGRDIGILYYQGKHCRCENIGDLANSCMRYDYCQDGRFHIYGDTATLAIVRCQLCGGVKARALVWDGVDGKQYIDRIYGRNTISQHIRTWATDHKMVPIYGGRGMESPMLVRVAIPKARAEYPGAPYVDTMFYWCDTCRELRTKPCKRDHDVAILRSTDARGHEGWIGRCPVCGGGRGRNGDCASTLRCAVCGEAWCRGGGRINNPHARIVCPGGHVYCPGCTRWSGDEGNHCECRECEECSRWSSPSSIRARHGLCRCGYEFAGMGRTVEVAVTRDRGDAVLTCPTCAYRDYGQFVTDLLTRCDDLHRGEVYATRADGHCRNCYQPILLADEEMTRGRQTVVVGDDVVIQAARMVMNEEGFYERMLQDVENMVAEFERAHEVAGEEE